MKTDDLISAIAADAGAVERPVSSTLPVAVLAATSVMVVVFFLMLGVRQDFASVLTGSWQFLFKFVLTIGVLVPSYFLVNELARPEANPQALKRLLWIVPAMMVGAVYYELHALPSDLWGTYAIGSMAWQCVYLIPTLSLLPLSVILYALRQGAPANPAVAGAFGGLLAASIGATLYACHCVNDSPLFIGAWYPIGTGIVVALGALIGSRVLKW